MLVTARISYEGREYLQATDSMTLSAHKHSFNMNCHDLTAFIVTVPSYCDCHREQTIGRGIFFLSESAFACTEYCCLAMGCDFDGSCRVEYTLSPPQIIPLSIHRVTVVDMSNSEEEEEPNGKSPGRSRISPL